MIFHSTRSACQCEWQQLSAGQKAQCVLGEERGAHRFHTTDALTASLLLEVGVSLEVQSLRVLQAPWSLSVFFSCVCYEGQFFPGASRANLGYLQTTVNEQISWYPNVFKQCDSDLIWMTSKSAVFETAIRGSR